MKQRRAVFMLNIVVGIGILLSVYGIFSSQTATYQTTPLGQSAVTAEGETVNSPEMSHGYKIVIDPGHGGKDPGAEGISGKWEHEYTLALSVKVFDLLRQDPEYEPYMTRTDNTFIELEDRAQMANDLDADAFISIHGNTYSDPAISGTESYYYADESFPLARDVHEELVKTTGFRDRGVKQEDWMVLTKCDVPAILLEVGFLTNPGDEETLLNDARQNEIAKAIVSGIKNYFGDSQI